MNLIKLLDVANPKSTKNTLNLLIKNYNDLETDITTKANKAVEDSTNAKSTSETALSVANSAKQTAEGIDSKATSALTNSNQAVTKANEAKDIAAQALVEKGTKVTVGGAAKSNYEITDTLLAQLKADETHRTVTDAEKEAWNSKVDAEFVNKRITFVDTNIFIIYGHEGLYYIPAGVTIYYGGTYFLKFKRFTGDTLLMITKTAYSSTEDMYIFTGNTVQLHSPQLITGISYPDSLGGDNNGICNTYNLPTEAVLDSLENSITDKNYVKNNFVPKTGDSKISGALTTNSLYTTLLRSRYITLRNATDDSSSKPQIYGSGNYIFIDADEIYWNNEQLLSKIYPVGSIYLTVATTTTGAASPASFFGGTWERIPAGYALWTASERNPETIPAGLPNIYGDFGAKTYSDDSAPTGAFWWSWTDSKVTPSGTSKDKNTRVQFNAQAQNTIYGNSTTVQPPAYKVYVWKRIR